MFAALSFLIIISSCTITSNVVREEDSEIEVFFCPQDMCQEKLLSLIAGSTDIRCAFYDLNLPDVIAALKQKNADVMVEDSTEIPGFKTFFSKDLMHNKFCIFDRKIVFTGSMNPTINDNFYNNNNILIIRSRMLAQNYLDEFEELKNGINGKGDKAKIQSLFLDSIYTENYFCPEDNCKLGVINALKKANSSIYFMIFTFADVDIGNLLYNKHYMGLDVKGVIEKRQSGSFSQYENIKDFTVLDDNGHTMHHKVFIIDNETVITGSFNPTKSANEGNDENILIIHDKAIAKKYVDEFNKVYYSDDSIPEKPSELMIKEIDYNPNGKDEGNEYVVLANIANTTLNLDYFLISNNKSNMKLNGSLDAGKSIRIVPKFALTNKAGQLILRHNDKIIDYAEWGNDWKLAQEGEIMLRVDDAISRESWVIE